jgi:nitrogen regulatory protein P-II 1
MKNLVMIVHANVQQDLADTLRGLPPVRGFTFTPAEGHGAQTAIEPFVSPRDKVVGYVPQVRVDVLLEEADLFLVLEAVRAAGRGAALGVYWVNPVHETGRL